MSRVAKTSEIIADYKLQEHPEGGYFTVADEQELSIPSPLSNGASRLLATSIFYLLSYDRPTGYIHMNKSVTYHVHHQGRAEYTLITPGNPPKIERKVVGPDVAAGETRLLVVGTGIWKMSKLLQEDVQRAEKGSSTEKEDLNCLITEVVVPGFHWDDHQYLKAEGLESLFKESPNGGDRVREFSYYLKPL